MDQIKIGNFLKELRKEKSLTQEQLAERFHTSSRTVSRWENGNNLPDISVLIELSEFYGIDIREIIDGERKPGSRNEEMKDTLVKVSEYTAAEKEQMLKRLLTGILMTIFSIMAAIVLMAYGIGKENGIAMYFIWTAFGVTFANLIEILKLTDSMSKRRERKFRKIAIAVCIGLIALSALVIVLVVTSLYL